MGKESRSVGQPVSWSDGPLIDACVSRHSAAAAVAPRDRITRTGDEARVQCAAPRDGGGAHARGSFEALSRPSLFPLGRKGLGKQEAGEHGACLWRLVRWGVHGSRSGKRLEACACKVFAERCFGLEKRMVASGSNPGLRTRPRGPTRAAPVDRIAWPAAQPGRWARAVSIEAACQGQEGEDLR